MADAAPGSIDEAMDWFRKHFDAEAARGLRVTYQFDLTGADGGSFYARIDDGRLETVRAEHHSPDARFRLAPRDFFGILAGCANPDLLFMAQRIEVDGDLSIALKMRRYFRRRR